MDELSGFPLSINKNDQSGLNFIGKRFKSLFNKIKPDVKYLLLAIPIIASFLILKEYQNRQSAKLNAAVHSASLSFQLANWSLPPEHTFGVWLNTDSPVTFARVSITFDPTAIKMTSEGSAGASLSRIVQITSMSEANSTGKLTLVLALDPAQKASPPSGAFQLANFNFDANTLTQNITTSISFNPSDSQIVALDESVFGIISVQNLNLTINPVATPTPAPINTTPTPTAKAKGGGAGATRTSKPKSTPTPKLSPTPTPSPV